ncbi:uncharacterized protein TNCV_1584151 [Trichonephila clavipes]|nr:uncharacterized protein TNCV_1584151 [Trichonephila clavipes]
MSSIPSATEDSTGVKRRSWLKVLPWCGVVVLKGRGEIKKVVFNMANLPSDPLTLMGGPGSRVVKVPDRGWSCHEFKPSTTKDPLCRGAMHVKSVESSNVLPLVWCGS